MDSRAEQLVGKIQMIDAKHKNYSSYNALQWKYLKRQLTISRHTLDQGRTTNHPPKHACTHRRTHYTDTPYKCITKCREWSILLPARKLCTQVQSNPINPKVKVVSFSLQKYKYTRLKNYVFQRLISCAWRALIMSVHHGQQKTFVLDILNIWDQDEVFKIRYQSLDYIMGI